MTAGTDLRNAREAAGFTQHQVAEALRVHRTTVVAWEQRAWIAPHKAQRYFEAVAALAKAA